MSIVAGNDAKAITRARRSSSLTYQALVAGRRILVAHPGENISFSVRIRGPTNHTISVEVAGIPTSIARVVINPSRATAPYVATITLNTSVNAEPGQYPFQLLIHDLDKNQSLGEEELNLLILPRRMTVSDYIKIKRIYQYEKLGAQGVIWYLIAKVFTKGASFMELKRAYELVCECSVKKATIANILKRMIRKNLIRKGIDGKYYAKVTKEEVAFIRINRSRVRIQRLAKTARKTEKRKKQKHEPYTARLAFKRAWEIAIKHNSLAAAYFLAYSLLGVRETGILLLWLNAMFVYCEQKTGFCHYFYSWLLHRYFQLLGLKQGIMYRDTIEYQKAIQIANKYIRKHYGSHQAARRLHYKLKEEKYIEYDDDVLNLEIIHYNDGDIGLRIWDNNMEKILHEENIVNKRVTKMEIKPVYPYEHIYESNEETYFNRPAGMY